MFGEGELHVRVTYHFFWFYRLSWIEYSF
jgi:hypothetical protein